MSGPIVDLPVRVCAGCKAVFMEDEKMSVEPERCPHCGRYPGPTRAGGDDDLSGWV